MPEFVPVYMLIVKVRPVWGKFKVIRIRTVQCIKEIFKVIKGNTCYCKFLLANTIVNTANEEEEAQYVSHTAKIGQKSDFLLLPFPMRS